MSGEAHTGVRKYLAHGMWAGEQSAARNTEKPFQWAAPGKGKDKGRHKQGFTGHTGSGQRDPVGMRKVRLKERGSARRPGRPADRSDRSAPPVKRRSGI